MEEKVLVNPNQKSNIKFVWIIHFLWNIFSGWLLWAILVIAYLLLKNNIEPETKATCYEIINFNISYWLYTWISALLMFVLIWFVLLPIVLIIWFIILIIWFIKHIAWDRYKYPFSITFLK